jgi:hypothetical protein|tara:strand:+ start:452 stop:649 length:198 start_codon:yes stop_codon:yes gene_type:complete
MSKTLNIGLELEKLIVKLMNSGKQGYVRNQIEKNGKRITYLHDPADNTNIKYSIMEQYEGYPRKK